MGMFDTLTVVGAADRGRFAAPWGRVYDELQSKDLCRLIGSKRPWLYKFTLSDGVLTCTNLEGDEEIPVDGTGTAHVYDFANGSAGWVEWRLTVEAGRVTAVESVCMRQPRHRFKEKQ